MASKPQQAIFDVLKLAYPDAQYDARVFGFEVDIYIPSRRIIVEYDGAVFHAFKGEKDSLKSTRLEEQGIRTVRVREEPLELLPGINCLGYSSKDTPYKVLFYLFAHYGYFAGEIQNTYNNLVHPVIEPVDIPMTSHEFSRMFVEWLLDNPNLFKRVSRDGKLHKYEYTPTVEAFGLYCSYTAREVRKRLKSDVGMFVLGVSAKTGLPEKVVMQALIVDADKVHARYGIVFA